LVSSVECKVRNFEEGNHTVTYIVVFPKSVAASQMSVNIFFKIYFCVQQKKEPEM